MKVEKIDWWQTFCVNVVPVSFAAFFIYFLFSVLDVVKKSESSPELVIVGLLCIALLCFVFMSRMRLGLEVVWKITNVSFVEKKPLPSSSIDFEEEVKDDDV